METLPGKERLTILRRLIAYSEKIFGFSRDIVAPVSDRRLAPRISTASIVKSTAVLFWARIGSLNALELVAGASFWKKWLGQPSCSADTIGRVHALLDADGLRQGIHHIYDRLKRNKALPDFQGWGQPFWTATKATPVTCAIAPAACSEPFTSTPEIASSFITGK